MCNTQTRQYIDQVVTDKVSSSTMFTLFDVTLEVKELEKGAGLPMSRHSHIHNDVRQSAEAIAIGNGWDRTLRSMGGQLQAFVYYDPNQHDPSTYQPLPRKDTAQATVTAVAAPPGINPAAVAFAGSSSPSLPAPASATDSDGDDDDDDDDYKQLATTTVQSSNGGKSPDRWGRLRVPSAVMKAAGFNPGDMAFVVQGTGLTIVKNPGPQTAVARYIVDHHANVRITPRTLAKTNLAGKSSYTLTASTDTVSVS